MRQANSLECVENSQLAFKILDYLRRNPSAKDSVEGIARWWVQEDPVEVRRVLEKLAELNLVGKRSNAAFDLYFATNGEQDMD
jgi:hypothetical protein